MKACDVLPVSMFFEIQRLSKTLGLYKRHLKVVVSIGIYHLSRLGHFRDISM